MEPPTKAPAAKALSTPMFDQQAKPTITRIPYYGNPDYQRELYELPGEMKEDMLERLQFLYGKEQAKATMPELERILKVHYAHKPPELIEAEKSFDPKERFTEKDVVLITYGDIVKGKDGKSPLASLYEFLEIYNRGGINTLHLLPFFPYSSDRGFSVIDYQSVDPTMGSWDDILHMAKRYDLMFDGVFNHCSAESRMFKGFVNGDPFYKKFFIAFDSPDDLTEDQRSKIFRPRTSDILTKFYTIEGEKHVWTTFSEDQIDLNFRNPAVLMRIVEALLFYVRQGADIIRLDAVTYIWREPGTDCVHLPETHEVVKLLRDVVDAVAPAVALITETNVPHEDNISYFGNGYDEAHMVYNFALPPLVLHTFYTGDATAISQWAAGLEVDSDVATFFNILDTHDGIGLMGVKGILNREEIDYIIQRALLNGAYISYKMTEGRTEEPYEINCTWWSALNSDTADEDIRFQVRRHFASRSIAMVLRGVPGVYVHGAIGTSNDRRVVEQSGHKRDINRQAIDCEAVAEKLQDPSSKESFIRRYQPRFGLTRVRYRAFHPHGRQQVLTISPSIFSVLRTSPEGDQRIFAFTNVTNRNVTIEVRISELGINETRWFDLLSDRDYRANNGVLSISFEPYDVVWLICGEELQKSLAQESS